MYPGPPRRVAKIAGRHAILLAVIAVRPHRVHEVIRDVDAGKGAVKRGGIEEIARDDFSRRCDTRRQHRRVPGETAKSDGRGFKDGDEPSSDVTRRASDEYGWYSRRFGLE